MFESITCTRCHGSGEYYYCSYYGTRCFKCAGQKSILTPRGKKAQDFYIALCSKPASELKIGDWISRTDFTHGGKAFTCKAQIIEIKEGSEVTGTNNGVPCKYTSIYLVTSNEKYGNSTVGTHDDSLIRPYSPDNAVHAQTALEYQQTLTKLGTVRKKQS